MLSQFCLWMRDLEVHKDKTSFQNLQTFISRCLRRIFKAFCPETVSSEDLQKVAKGKPIIQQIKEGKWRWIGHSLRKDPQAVQRQVVNWKPQGHGGHGGER
jgi:hypothetical protein